MATGRPLSFAGLILRALAGNVSSHPRTHTGRLAPARGHEHEVMGQDYGRTAVQEGILTYRPSLSPTAVPENGIFCCITEGCAPWGAGLAFDHDTHSALSQLLGWPAWVQAGPLTGAAVLTPLGAPEK